MYASPAGRDAAHSGGRERRRGITRGRRADELPALGHLHLNDENGSVGRHGAPLDSDGRADRFERLGILPGRRRGGRAENGGGLHGLRGRAGLPCSSLRGQARPARRPAGRAAPAMHDVSRSGRVVRNRACPRPTTDGGVRRRCSSVGRVWTASRRPRCGVWRATRSRASIPDQERRSASDQTGDAPVRPRDRRARGLRRRTGPGGQHRRHAERLVPEPEPDHRGQQPRPRLVDVQRQHRVERPLPVDVEQAQLLVAQRPADALRLRAEPPSRARLADHHVHEHGVLPEPRAHDRGDPQ